MSADGGADGGVNRRRLLKGGVIAAATAGAGIGAITVGSNSASAQVSGLSADDVSVSSTDGTISTLTVDPDITVDWSNFDPPADRYQVNTRVTGPNVTDRRVDRQSFTLNGTQASGTVNLDLGTINLLSTNGGELDPSALEDTTEGDGPEETDVEVKIFVRFYDVDNNVPNPIPSETATFTVSVQNEAATVSLSGSLNTAGSA